MIEGKARSPEAVAATERSTAEADRQLRLQVDTAAAPAKQILFGDLHVHTTYSIDAFVYSLPLMGGEGTHPPADACDFARHCAGLDFFSINDHAEGLTPEMWERTKDSIRRCNDLAADPVHPDLVAFVGWEWTQVGTTPDTHYGHRNVVLLGLDEAELPARPITALSPGTLERAPNPWLLRSAEAVGSMVSDDLGHFMWWVGRMARTPDCPHGVDTRHLPADCRENAETPRELFEKLSQWDVDALVIPHGLAWGIHAPSGARMDNQLAPSQHDPDYQMLLEIFSGHGNSEEFRQFPEIEPDPNGEHRCPEPSPDFLPCCWQAGEIMRRRCGDLPDEECERRVELAKQLAFDASAEVHRVFPDAQSEDWLDCDQCRNCFKPAMTLRPGETAQYGLAISAFTDDGGEQQPHRFRYGFIASSDNHSARAATGYKQVHRRAMTDASGFSSPLSDRLLGTWITGRQIDPRMPQAVPQEERGFRSLFDTERVASFMYPGGLVAVHADGRDRRAIWEGLKRREVYGTSGPRILLWFDLLNGPDGRAPMGSAVELSETPRFEVRAVGSFVQQPGCPETSRGGLSAERLDHLCKGECYHPGNERHPIVAIEVVRVRPQRTPGENVAELIDDPWQRFGCMTDAAGCVVQFTDAEFSATARDAVYYVRVLQEETAAINGANLRTEFDTDGNAIGVSPCYGGYRTDASDDCLAPGQERAWSSPIYIDWAGQGS